MQLSARVLVLVLFTACLPTLPGEDAGTDASRPLPPPAIDLSVGATHACARMADSTVRCWGSYTNAELTPLTRDDLPAVVSGLTGARNVTLGEDFGCAYFGPGTRCWGVGAQGQLGNGDTMNSNTPVPVTGEAVADAVAGGRHACARIDGGVITCWGDNSQGQLGAGSGMAQSPTPLQIANLNGSQVDLGVAHGCARLVSGSVFCWGANQEGQLGDGTNSQQNTPVRVLGLDALAVSAGRFSCALATDRSVWCWGLGSSTPSAWLFPDGGWREISVGTQLCARAADGTIRCLDRADAGVDVPVPNAVQLGSGDRYSCARTDGGTVWCWGRNDLGQLGDGTRTSSTPPVKVGF